MLTNNKISNDLSIGFDENIDTRKEELTTFKEAPNMGQFRLKFSEKFYLDMLSINKTVPTDYAIF